MFWLRKSTTGPGDLVEVETSGIGALKNTVVMERW